MSRSRTPPPHRSDPLGETLHQLRMTGTLYCRSELSAPWGIAIPAFPGMMTFVILTAGGCWLEMAGVEPAELGPGSLTLIPHGTPHRLRSDRRARTVELSELPVQAITDRYETLRWGGGGAVTEATYGVVRFDHVAAHRLVDLLPPVLSVDGWDDESGAWLHSTLQLITREAKTMRPGGETVVTRLADVLVIQAIRRWLATSPDADRGWLAALRDPQIGRALAAIHRDPQEDWSVAGLAAQAGMSRSAFSARFTELLDESPMRYLTAWRLNLARTHLQTTTEPLACVATRFGYGSEAAFCRAFKRVFGLSPGAARAQATPREFGDLRT
ncbi:MAG: cupin domain-containing protein [Nannocystales bacterium]